MGIYIVKEKDRHKYEKVTDTYTVKDAELIATGFNMESGGKVPQPICRRCDAWLRRAAKSDENALKALSEPTEAEEKKIESMKKKKR